MFTFALSLGSVLTSRDGDLGFHLRLGESMLMNLSIPAVDTFSHTAPGGMTLPHEWLGEVILSATFRAAGFDGVAILTGIAVALPWAVVVRHLLAAGRRPAAVLPVALLGAAASVVHWAARPHVFSFLFVALWVLWLEEIRGGRRTHLWRLIPLTTLWANMHPGFVAGLMLVALYVVGALMEQGWQAPTTRHLATLLGASVLATVINPVGWKLWSAVGYLGQPFLLSFTDEWTSPDFHLLGFWPFLALLLSTIAFRGRLKSTPLLVVLAWTALALYARRNVGVYALAVTPLLATAVDEWSTQRAADDGRRSAADSLHRFVRGGALSLTVVVVVVLLLTSTPGSEYEFSAGAFPVEVMRKLGQDPPGERVFNQFEWGGYLIFCCDLSVFIDGRTDYYGSDLTERYDSVIEARPGWEETLERYAVDWVLVNTSKPLAQVLERHPGWNEVYRDQVAVAFSRLPS